MIPWCSERGARARLVCLYVASLSPGAPRGVPGQGLSVFMYSLSPGAPNPRVCQGKTCLSAGTATCPLSLLFPSF